MDPNASLLTRYTLAWHRSKVPSWRLLVVAVLHFPVMLWLMAATSHGLPLAWTMIVIGGWFVAPILIGIWSRSGWWPLGLMVGPVLGLAVLIQPYWVLSSFFVPSRSGRGQAGDSLSELSALVGLAAYGLISFVLSLLGALAGMFIWHRIDLRVNHATEGRQVE